MDSESSTKYRSNPYSLNVQQDLQFVTCNGQLFSLLHSKLRQSVHLIWVVSGCHWQQCKRQNKERSLHSFASQNWARRCSNWSHTFFTSCETLGDDFQRNLGTWGAMSATPKIPRTAIHDCKAISRCKEKQLDTMVATKLTNKVPKKLSLPQRK